MKITKIFRPGSLAIGAAVVTVIAVAATYFSPEEQPLGYIAPLELTTTDLTYGAKAYRTWFENGAWQGDLVEHAVTATGGISTSVDLNDISPSNPLGTQWSANVQFAAAVTATPDYWTSTRKIITKNTIGQTAFRWTNLTDPQKAAIDPVAAAVSPVVTNSDLLDFVRGDRSNEKRNGGTLRSRVGILGDMIHSNPEYVAKPKEVFTDTSYVAFANANATRAGRVYVGANDGMLHVFDADTGNEVYAYIPSMVIPNLKKLAAYPYNHTYFVDGEISVRDVEYDGAWHSVLVGGLGAGGKGLYGLDITNPDLTSEASNTGTNKKVLWEIDGASNADLGYTYGRPIITKFNDDKWYAVIGNGYNSTNGIAKLMFVDVKTGAVQSITTGAGTSAAPNGLSSPSLIDVDSDGKADFAYAGDIDGKMWKFDLTAGTFGSWKVAFAGAPLFDGGPTQPITTAPQVATHPTKGFMVYYGTGRNYTTSDTANQALQSIYGLWDTKDTPITPNLLLQQFSTDITYTSTGVSDTVRTLTDNTVSWVGSTVHTGWKVDLPAGERVLVPVKLRAGRLKVIATNPELMDNWLLEFAYLSGGAALGTIFDLDRNGTLDLDDRVDSNTNGVKSDLVDIPMGWQRENGIMSSVNIAQLGGGGQDTMFINYLQPAIATPEDICVGNCTGGIAGGHIDVDMDTDYGGETDVHTHEYDDAANRTYVDIFDYGNKLVEVGTTFTSNNTGFVDATLKNIVDPEGRFVVVVANADLSMGSTITLGKKDWNVVEYQKMIHQKLADWDGTGDLVDDAGDSLLFKLSADRKTVSYKLNGGVYQEGGNIRNTFFSNAIINGGLHPTVASCVKKTGNITNDRWRNGSLITHLVDADIFKSGAKLNALVMQDPSDLITEVTLFDGSKVKLIEDGVTYGGLIAKSNADGFLYESTLFWHYEGTPCYGDAGYDEEVIRVVNAIKNGTDAGAGGGDTSASLTQAEYDRLLAAEGVDDLAGLQDLIDAAQQCEEENREVTEGKGKNKVVISGDKAKSDECRDLKTRLIALKALAASIVSGSGTGGSGTESGTAGGIDTSGGVKVISDASDTGTNAGRNFTMGRRSWVDITPK